MKSVALLVLVAIAGLAIPVNAEVRVLGVEFDPAAYSTGQVVTAIVVWDDSGTRWIPERMNSSFPDSGEDGPTILSAQTQERGGRPMLVIRFIAWKPGPGVLPSLYVGGQAFPPIPVDAVSVLPSLGRANPEPLPQLEPPGLKARVYLMVGGFLLTVLVSIFVAFRLIPWLRALRAHWAFRRARREFGSVLAYLRESSGGADAWAVLGTALKRYLGTRSEVDFLPLTPREIAGLPLESVPGAVGPDAAVILSVGEFVRFGGSTDGDLPAALALAEALAETIEAAVAADSPKSGFSAAGMGAPGGRP
ncbi:MAG: hypothetical protein E4H20_04640 [Spirochaetales bacterium]|nr:MAG: hypothetical protein E4H20_04640 [Spirochaetales bacterium]